VTKAEVAAMCAQLAIVGAVYAIKPKALKGGTGGDDPAIMTPSPIHLAYRLRNTGLRDRESPSCQIP